MTGRLPRGDGVSTLRTRQASLSGWGASSARSAEPRKYSPMVGLRKMLPGPWTQRGPVWVQSRMPVQGAGLVGGRKRAELA